MADEKWGVGDPNKAAVWESQIMDDGTPFTVLYGEHPHSRNDNRMYARFQDGRIEDFDGHRVRTRVDLRTFNYLKCSGLSGNEVRRGGQLRIYLNDRLVWAKFVREADHGLLLAHQTLERLNDCPVQLWKPEEPEIGRRVFYRDQPAIIEAFYCDENESSGNRLVLRHDGGKFSAPCWSDGDPEDASERVVTNTLHEAIWWWREDKARGETP